MRKASVVQDIRLVDFGDDWRGVRTIRGKDFEDDAHNIGGEKNWGGVNGGIDCGIISIERVEDGGRNIGGEHYGLWNS